MRSLVGLAAVVGAACVLASGCGDDCEAGPGDAGDSGLSLATSAGTFVYGNARSSPNNDCTPFQGREPTSLTVDMVQVDPATETSLFLTLCIPEPDNVEDGNYALDYDMSDAPVQLITVFGRTTDGAVFELDTGAAGLDATIELSGFCDDGAAERGYAIALAGNVPVVNDDTREIATLGGAPIAVVAQTLLE